MSFFRPRRVRGPEHASERDQAGARPAAHSLRRRVEPERAAAVEAGSKALNGRLGRDPVVFALGLVAAVMVVRPVAGLAVAALTGGPYEDEAGEVTADLAGAVAVVAVLGALGWWRRAGFAGPSHWRHVHLLIGPAMLGVLALLGSDIDLSDATRAALELPQPFLTGFWEEGLIRGFLLFALLIAAVRAGRGPWAAVLGSAFVFGLLHFLNLVHGADLAATASQALFAAFDGGSVIFGLLFALYGAFLLRRVKAEELPDAAPGGPGQAVSP